MWVFVVSSETVRGSYEIRDVFSTHKKAKAYQDRLIEVLDKKEKVRIDEEELDTELLPY